MLKRRPIPIQMELSSPGKKQAKHDPRLFGKWPEVLHVMMSSEALFNEASAAAAAFEVSQVFLTHSLLTSGNRCDMSLRPHGNRLSPVWQHGRQLQLICCTSE